MNITTNHTARVLIAAATVCAALVTGARADGVAQMHVKYADLDVAGGAGAAVLYQRIKVAATEVCGLDGERDLGRKAHAKVCVDRAIAQAVATVNAPALTGLYQTKLGGNTQLASIR
jgi:UrcA family protein